MKAVAVIEETTCIFEVQRENDVQYSDASRFVSLTKSLV